MDRPVLQHAGDPAQQPTGSLPQGGAHAREGHACSDRLPGESCSWEDVLLAGGPWRFPVGLRDSIVWETAELTHHPNSSTSGAKG